MNDQHTDADSGTFTTHVRLCLRPDRAAGYIKLATGAGWTDPRVFAGNGMVGITATAPSTIPMEPHSGAVATDYELVRSPTFGSS